MVKRGVGGVTQVLEVLPGVYGQIAGYDMDREQGNAGVRQYALAMS
jgi:hypothetical protein